MSAARLDAAVDLAVQGNRQPPPAFLRPLDVAPSFDWSRERLAARSGIKLRERRAREPISPAAATAIADRIVAAAGSKAAAEAVANLKKLLPDQQRAALQLASTLCGKQIASMADAEALQHEPSGSVRHQEDALIRVNWEVTPPPNECDYSWSALTALDERQLREEAKRLAAEAAEARRLRPQDYVGVPDYELREAEDPALHLRRLRRQQRRARVWHDTALRQVGPHVGERAVSYEMLEAWAQARERTRRWRVTKKVAFADGESVPLTDVHERAAKARLAMVYTVVKAMEHHGQAHDHTALFLTLTLPGEYHAVTSGAEADDGNYPDARPNPNWTRDHGPKAQVTELQHRWKLIRARFATIPELRRYYGCVVPEPHLDGTPHYHLMVWFPKTITRKGRTRRTEHVVRKILRDIAPGRQSKVITVEKTSENSMTPSSYVMEYVMKCVDVLDDEDGLEDDSPFRHSAWASAHGLRRFRLLGAHGVLKIWQRLWNARNDEDLSPLANQVRSAMNECKAQGDLAGALPDKSPEATQARAKQAEAAARALMLLGGLPTKEKPQRRLRLDYEERLSKHGRPRTEAVRVEEQARQPDGTWMIAGAFALKRGKAELVRSGMLDPAEKEDIEDAIEAAFQTLEPANDTKEGEEEGEDGFTVVATGPRAGADAPSEATDRAVMTAGDAVPASESTARPPPQAPPEPVNGSELLVSKAA